MNKFNDKDINDKTSEYIINYYNHETRNCLPKWVYTLCFVLFIIGFLFPYFWCASILLLIILYLSYLSTIGISNNKKIKEIKNNKYITQLGICKNKETIKHSRGRYSYSNFYIVFQEEKNIKKISKQKIEVSEYAYKCININDKVLLIEYLDLKQKKDIIPISFN